MNEWGLKFALGLLGGISTFQNFPKWEKKNAGNHLNHLFSEEEISSGFVIVGDISTGKDQRIYLNLQAYFTNSTVIVYSTNWQVFSTLLLHKTLPKLSKVCLQKPPQEQSVKAHQQGTQQHEDTSWTNEYTLENLLKNRINPRCQSTE